MKVKCIKRYSDICLKEIVEKGTVLEVTENRGAHLISEGVAEIDRRVAEKYRWPYMDTPDGRFYRCSGNPAYPFLYPAMKDNEEQILKMLGGSLASDLEDI